MSKATTVASNGELVDAIIFELGDLAGSKAECAPNLGVDFGCGKLVSQSKRFVRLKRTTKFRGRQRKVVKLTKITTIVAGVPPPTQMVVSEKIRLERALKRCAKTFAVFV